MDSQHEFSQNIQNKWKNDKNPRDGRTNERTNENKIVIKTKTKIKDIKSLEELKLRKAIYLFSRTQTKDLAKKRDNSNTLSVLKRVLYVQAMIVMMTVACNRFTTGCFHE